MSGYHMDDTPSWDVPWYRTAWWKTGRGQNFLLFVTVLVACFAIGEFTSDAKAVEVSLALGIGYVITRSFWIYRREAWFWVTLATFVVLHAAAILIIPAQIPGGPALLHLLPVVMGDTFVMYAVLTLLASRFSSAKDSRARDQTP